MRLKTAWLTSLGDEELRVSELSSLLSLTSASTLSAYRAKTPLCLEGFYLNDLFDLGYISPTHAQTHVALWARICPSGGFFWGQLSSGQHVATMLVSVYKHSLM